VGDTTARHRANAPTATQGDSVLEFVASAANQTFFSRETAGKFAYFKNLTLTAVTTGGDYTYLVNKNADDDPTWTGQLPYKLYQEQSNLSGINGIDLQGDANGGGAMISVDNCCFYGFSGFAVGIPDHKYVTNCAFMHCNEGVRSYGTDAILQGNWWSRCNIAVHCTAEHHTDYITLEISNSWADQLTSHFVLCENPASGNNNTATTLLINNVWVDMVEGSAIYVKGLLQNSRITGRFSRIGMMYATDSRVKADYTDNIVPYAVCIAVGSMVNSDINISCPLRTIGQGARKNDASATCPDMLINTCGSNTDYHGNSSVQRNNISVIDRPLAKISYNSMTDTIIHTNDNVIRANGGYNYNFSNVVVRTRTPVGWYPSAKEGDFFIDKTNKKFYVSKTAGSNTDWDLVADFDTSSDIDFTTLLGGGN
jgi:hypothetical protein